MGRQEHLKRLRMLSGQVSQRLREQPGHEALHVDMTRRLEGGPSVEVARAFESDRIRYGRLFYAEHEEVPSIFSLLLVPRARWGSAVFGALQALGQEALDLVLYDAYEVGDVASPESQDPGLGAPQTPGHVDLSRLPPKVRAAFGDEAWMWRSLSFLEAETTIDDFHRALDEWWSGLKDVPETTPSVVEPRRKGHQSYVDGLRRRESAASANLERLLGPSLKVDPFLKRFYFPVNLDSPQGGA